MMDLRLEIAPSCTDAMAAIERYARSQDEGVFVFGIVDLYIPKAPGLDPSIRYGVTVAAEFRRRGMHFVFLSANADAADILGQESLGTVPYYVKEQYPQPWRLPEALSTMVLGELRSHVSWIVLDDVIADLAPESDVLFEDYSAPAEASGAPLGYRYFPYFGSYRDFVERSECRPNLELNRSYSVRADRYHCDEFVLQSLLVLLNQTIGAADIPPRVSYGHAHDPAFLSKLFRHSAEPGMAIAVDILRVDPDNLSLQRLRDLLIQVSAKRSMSIFVVPDDESADRYTEQLREFRVAAIDELPHDRLADSAEREVLLRRSAMLALQQWFAKTVESSASLNATLHLRHPELVVNPIDWCILLEPKDLAEDLSDPYEILHEFAVSLRKLGRDGQDALVGAISEGLPAPYSCLLRVADRAMRKPDLRVEEGAWIERAIDSWLNSSRRFPHGLGQQMERKRGQLDAEMSRNWEDYCYSILVSMLAEYTANRAGVTPSTAREIDLARVERFVESLGGHSFVAEDAVSVDWDAFELLRWPHLRYPMPSAITRRLRQAGRYLWIQPEGLDLAAALPAGRARYRALIDSVDHYSSTLAWCRKVVPHLPHGWGKSVSYLTDVISEHRIGQAWQEERSDVWDSLLALLRNGAPVLFLADQILKGRPITGSRKSAAEFLGAVQGYGKILSRVRGNRSAKLRESMRANWRVAGGSSGMRRAMQIARLTGNGERGAGAEHGEPSVDEALSTVLGSALLEVLKGLRNINGNSLRGGSSLSPEVFDKLVGVVSAACGCVDDATREALLQGALEESGQRRAKDNAFVPSTFGTKADCLWTVFDLFGALDHLTRRLRYFDGYHFLAAVNDLRLEHKDTAPQAPLAVIETTLELFVDGIQGIIAHLALCVEAAGHAELADAIRPEGMKLIMPDGLGFPNPEELGRVLQVRVTDDTWETYCLGIPGKGSSSRRCYHTEGRVVALAEG
jgi:hypothetical protein